MVKKNNPKFQKKVLFGMLGSLLVTSVLYKIGFGFLWKALKLNVSKGSAVPSINDVEKFPKKIINHSLPKPWRVHCNVNQQILSPQLLEELTRTNVASILVVQNQEIIYEKYYKGYQKQSLTNSFSMAKGILSLLVGCAIDDGFLSSEEEKVSKYIKKYNENQFGKHLTFKNLMTMESGLDWSEEYRHPFAENSKQYFLDDLNEQALAVEFKKMPGLEYEYQSVAAQILGLALRKAINMDLSEYLSRKLWIPLGMQSPAFWSTDRRGMEKAFCCIHATARDFAKIGQLLLQKGEWQSKRLLSEEFCTKALHSSKQNKAFGYSIWINDDAKIPYRFFYGFMGQFIIMIPDKKMVIVKTGSYNSLEVDDLLRPLQVQMLVDEFAK